jgi:hypothetical protein
VSPSSATPFGCSSVINATGATNPDW